MAEPILAALRQAAIPVRLVTDREPERPKEILATIAWLRLAMSRDAGRGTWDPAADDAFRRACAFPARGIGGVLFGRLREHAAEKGLALAQAVATLPVTPKERQGLEAVLGVAGEIAEGIVRRKLGPADALRLAAEVSEIAERLAPDGNFGQAGWRRCGPRTNRATSRPILDEVSRCWICGPVVLSAVSPSALAIAFT